MERLRKLFSDLEQSTQSPKTALRVSIPSFLLTSVISKSSEATAAGDSPLSFLARILSDETSFYTPGDWSGIAPPKCIVSSIAWNFRDSSDDCFVSALRGSRLQVSLSDCRMLVTACERIANHLGGPPDNFLSEPLFQEKLLSSTLLFAFESLTQNDIVSAPHAACAWLACWETAGTLLELMWNRGGIGGALSKKLCILLRDPASDKQRTVKLILCCISSTKRRNPMGTRSFASLFLPHLLEYADCARALFDEGIQLMLLVRREEGNSPEGDAEGHLEARGRYFEAIKGGFSDVAHTTFFETVVNSSLPRDTLRFLFCTALPKLAAAQDQNASSSGLLRHFLHPLFHSWASDDCHRVDERVLSSRCTAMMYCLPMVCAEKDLAASWSMSCSCNEKLLVQNINLIALVMKGVSSRFSAYHPDNSLRKQGSLVAASCSRLFLTDEVSEKFEEFPNVLEEWDQLENSSVLTPKTSAQATSDEHLILAAVNHYPIDPDMTLSGVILLPCDERPSVNFIRQNEISEAGGVRFSPSGVTQLPNEELADQLRHVYSQLLGVSDKSLQHETEHEGADRVGRAIQSLPHVLQAMASRRSSSSSAVSQSLATLLPGIFAALFCFSRSYTPDLELTVRECRRKSVLLSFSLSPKGSLSAVSRLLFSSNTSIACKTELCTLIGEAVELLSAVPVATHVLEEGMQKPQKLKYPPIATPRVSLSSGQGFNSRRWGHAAHRSTGAQYSNEAADIAPAVLELFATQSESYSFEGDDMMFTPVEMLRAVGKLFNSIALVRHVVPVLAPKAVSFLTRFVRHTLPIVRANAWMAIENTLKSWRGPSLVCSADWTSTTVHVAGLASAALSREVVPFVVASILSLFQSIESQSQDRLTEN
jgi:hypothetical protein